MQDATAALPPFLAAPLAICLLGGLLLALGQRVLGWLRLPLTTLSPAEQSFLALSFGVGLIQYVPYLLGTFGILSKRTVLVSLALLAVLLGKDLAAIARRLLAGLRAGGFARPGPAVTAWLCVFTAVMVVLLLRALSIGPFADDDGYHLSAPRRWLREGQLSYLPSYTTTNASLGFEMLYVIGLATLGSSGIKAIHFAAGLTSFFGLWLCARQLQRGTAALLTVSLLLVTNHILNVPYVMGMAYVDFGPCWMTMAAVLVWLHWREQPHASLLLALALFCGFAGSFKSTALNVGLGWALILTLDARQLGLKWSKILKSAVGLGLVALAPLVPWLFRSWRLTGNPVYPMVASVIPTRDWTPEIAAVFGRFMRFYSWGLAAGASLSEERRKLIILGTLALVVVVGGVLAVVVRERVLRLLVVFGTLTTLITVLVAGMIFRYAMPAAMCLGLALCCWLDKFSRRACVWVATGLLAATLVVQARDPANGNLTTHFRVALGISSMDEAYASDDAWNTWRYINSSTPPDARVLFAAFYTTYGAASFGGFWVDRTCFTSDSHAQAYIRFDAWDAFLHSLERAGVTHVVIADRQFMAGRHGFSFPAGINEYPFAQRVVQTHGEKLAQFGHLQLYRLRSLGGG